MDFRITAQPRIEPVPGRVAKLRVFVNFEARQSRPDEGHAYLLDIIPRFDLLGITVPQVTEETGLQTGEDMSYIGGRELRYLLTLSRDLISQVEAARTDDVSMSLVLYARYLVTVKATPAQGVAQTVALEARPAMQSAGHTLDISESKWLGLLDKVGYFSAWLLEVPRPKIEGWDTTINFLKATEERILSHDPEGAIAQCRAAWKSVQPVIEARWADISAEINRGSKEEAGQPPKAERVENLWKDTLKFANTGSHPEYYAASMNDAQLAYQLTCSTLAYLSRKLVEADQRQKSV